MKGYATFSNEIAYKIAYMKLHNAGFDSSDRKKSNDRRYFNFCVPLSILGFCEDYKRVLINAHELILIRVSNSYIYIVGDTTTEPTFKLFKIQ